MNKGGYVQDASGVIVKNGQGLCVRTSYWTPALAQAECEGGMAAPAAVMAAPAAVMMAAPAATTYVAPAGTTYVAPAAPGMAKPAAPVAAPVAAPAAPAAVRPAAPAAPAAPAVTVEKVTFAADAFFDTNKAVLKPEAKAKLDDLASKIKAITLEVIIAVGHTDSDASDAYNQKLSVKRAEAVKAYLVTKGIEANRVYTEGKGEKQPVADNKTKEGKAKNRRTEIEVVGTRSIKK
jgi:OOP family OmpA-OmpF porin